MESMPLSCMACGWVRDSDRLWSIQVKKKPRHDALAKKGCERDGFRILLMRNMDGVAPQQAYDAPGGKYKAGLGICCKHLSQYGVIVTAKKRWFARI
jgi:hypothetical protein